MVRLNASLLVLAIVLAAPLALAGPNVNAHLAAHGAHGKPTPAPAPEPNATSPPPAATSTPAPAPLHVASQPQVPAPRSLISSSASSPAYPTTAERRMAAFDLGGGSDVAGGSALAAGAVTIATTVPSPLHSAWAFALPLLGMFGVGAALLLRPARKTAASAEPSAVAKFPYSMTFSSVDVRALLTTGKAAVERGALAEAVAWFSQALTLEPRLSVAHFAKGVCLASLGRHEEAYEALESAYAIDPGEGAIRLEFARASARTGRGALAMDALGPLLRLVPELAQDVAEDDAFAQLFDHPRFLAMTGRL